MKKQKIKKKKNYLQKKNYQIYLNYSKKKFGKTNSEQQNLWHERDLFLQLFLEKENNTAFSPPFKVFHDCELIQSLDEAVTNVEKLEKQTEI